MDTFYLKTKIVFRGGLDTVLDRMRKVFLVTDPFMVQSGKSAYVTDRLDAAGKAWRIFSDISVDPDIDVVVRGVQELLAFEPDTVICLGGGAAIDAAKAMVFTAARASGDAGRPLFVAIPTTSGTGSEVTSFSVITDREKAVKYPLIDESLLPDVAILDASLTVSVPPSVTADTGMDVLTHAVEAFVSTEHGHYSDAMAEKAIKLVRAHLMDAWRSPGDLEARQGMHDASCLAGIAFNNAGLGLNHGMAHALGARFHIPHGRANAILLPYVMSFNAGCDTGLTDAAERYARIARLLGMGSGSLRQSALNLIRMTKRYQEQLRLPGTIQAAGVDRDAFEEAVPAMSAAALADRCTATNPRPCTEEEIAALFRRAYTGKGI